MKIIIQFIFNLLLSIDQLANTILLGHPDETLSSRLGKAKGKEKYFWVKFFRVIIDRLFWFDKEIKKGRIINHCEKSVMPLEQINFRETTRYEIWSWNK